MLSRTASSATVSTVFARARGRTAFAPRRFSLVLQLDHVFTSFCARARASLLKRAGGGIPYIYIRTTVERYWNYSRLHCDY